MIQKVLLTLGFLICSEAFTVKQLIYPGQNEYFELPIIHINDFHARFVQTNKASSTCHDEEKTDCIGGLARVVTAIQQIKREHPNAIFLNAGDHYQGTLWYNVHRWNATVHFMNKLPHDVMTIGNHDFDDGIEGLIPFLQRSKSPIVVTNIDDTEEPSMKGLYENSTIIVRGNRKIGVIGVIIKSTNTLSSPGKLKFLDEVESVNEEAKRLKAQGIDIIIVLSHVGLDIDKIMAASCPDVDVIVGGHSHSFLFTGNPPSGEVPEDEYPVIVTQSKTNRTVLIVQAASYTKYLGNLTVWFDSQGEVVDWQGDPITLDHFIEQDAETLEELKPWEEPVKALEKSVVGETKNYLNSTCRIGECNLSNLITDAMVHSFMNKSKDSRYWTYAAISCMNVGGIRSDIPPGNITYGDVVVTQPFENTWDAVELRGDDLKTALEESVKRSLRKDIFVGSGFLQWSGIRVTYNLSNPFNSRVVNMKVRCQKCSSPRFEDLDVTQWYRIIVPSFILSGGDNMTTIKTKHRNHEPGSLDTPQIIDFLKSISPFRYEKDGRLKFVGEWSG
ncbi:hypothetical protein QAD02_023148 [Eretmocerus hayati]|uniref:Uncharacterized protein n=1 Tax=Eretmocerus hayati TaxID=131215 RepID=A0ACC2PUT7_9HYME|nr:hypothetical protein QAD02_023148 [Eretmocerus hayati]